MKEEKDLAVVEYETAHGAVKLSPTIVRQYLVNGNGTVTDQEVLMFLKLCQYQRLNPFLREAYLIKYGNSQPATMVTGKDAFTQRAESNEDYDGMTAGVVIGDDTGIHERPGSMILDHEMLVGGWAKVYRKNQKHPVEITVSMNEYMGTKQDGTPNRQWSRMPGTMIRKVAMVQALREAFPHAFTGMYSAEEMAVNESELIVPDEPDPTQDDKPGKKTTTKKTTKKTAMTDEKKRKAERDPIIQAIGEVVCNPIFTDAERAEARKAVEGAKELPSLKYVLEVWEKKLQEKDEASLAELNAEAASEADSETQPEIF